MSTGSDLAKKFFSPVKVTGEKQRGKPGNEKAESETFLDFSFCGSQLFQGLKTKF